MTDQNPEQVLAPVIHRAHGHTDGGTCDKCDKQAGQAVAALRSAGYLLDTEPADAAWQWREWIHEQPDLSKCSVMADTCPDWPLAHRLAEQAARIRGGSSHD